MNELKYRIRNNKGLIKRIKTNEYLREMLRNHHCLFLQALPGSGKTSAMYSLINEFYKERYIYYHIDSRDNDYDLFIKHMKNAFSYASLNIDDLQIDKPYLFVLDQFENITNENIIQYIKQLIIYMPHQLYFIILSRNPLHPLFYELIQYHYLSLAKNCPLFFDKNETIKLAKQLHVKNINPYLLHQQTNGWPLVVSYQFQHDHQIKDNDYILFDFFERMTMSSSKIYILELIGLAPYITIDLLESLQLEHFEKDIEYLINVSLIQKHHGELTTIPIYKTYIIKKYGEEYKKILETVKFYYLKNQYLLDLLTYYYFCRKDELLNFISKYDLNIANIAHIKQIKGISDAYFNNEDIHILYIKAVNYYLHFHIKEYQEIIETLKSYQKTIDVKTRIINLMYLSQEYDLEAILAYKTPELSLYNMIRNHASFLNGQRDLSELINYRYTDYQKYMKYLLLFNENEKQRLQIAEIEYLLYIGYPQTSLEKIESFIQKYKQLSSDMLMVISVLYLKIYYVLSLKESALRFYRIYRDKLSINRNDKEHHRFMKLYNIYCYCLLNDVNKVYDWYRVVKLDDEVNHDNYFQYYLIARIHYMMKRYDQAYYCLTKLEGYFRQEKRIIDLSECLFMMGCCLLATKHEDKALHYVVEAFVWVGKYRYVFPFITYGKYGLELIKKYKKLMIGEKPIKRTYENSLLKKSYSQYLQFIIKECEKNMKDYPLIEPASIELTVKERTVLKCILKGYTNKEIAEELVISIPTVKTHISNIYSKLGVKNRTQAIHFVKEAQLLEN